MGRPAAPQSPSGAATLHSVSELSGELSPGRHCYSTVSLAVIGCHCLGIYTVILLPLLLVSVEMTV